ncbi:MAG: 30S ribosomal protein S4 [Deltaproteobacteria bacterium]|jgi:small subunit ribosomal protein S4|nr:30S ribosomal protein S4 [Deltaproteobacteria bacterium]MBK8693120.1 30S ribosomal protein S4 [Deltaproteobacteria bacterium]MBP6830327.1 30S ribosomal protein S4 [Deltaproteobacteria bacterium]MBP9107518.1 30S ribosomal protein S4 [Gemmatimonadaceae bacterium]TAK23649.1 MAG: 30S ribosomal protein S4 [Myxococcaceae bacterium]
MARYIGPVCKLCRREGMELYLKGDRCYTEKCSFKRRPRPPGQHGEQRVKFSEYGLRLREKQKVRRIYGVLERQFRKYFAEADRTKGVTGENLLALLERRLDNVVYRLGFAATRNEARQLVLHCHVTVNGKRVNIPSFLVKAGDKISIREKSREIARVKESVTGAERRSPTTWLELEKESFTGTVKTLPLREEVGLEIKEQLIVEFYSR